MLELILQFMKKWVDWKKLIIDDLCTYVDELPLQESFLISGCYNLVTVFSLVKYGP